MLTPNWVFYACIFLVSAFTIFVLDRQKRK